MQDKTTIARPYANAVFDQATEEGDFEQWSTLLNVLSQIVRDQQMKMILNSPKISHQQLLQLVSEIVGTRLSQTGANFIKVLISANRLGYVTQIFDLFEKRRAEAEGRIEINVVSAFELDSDQEKIISESMGKRLGKKVSILSAVDKSLIGGMIITAGDSVIDASLRGRLTELRNSLIG
ncbi:MAG: F-type H+-transporting ATPase subunit delta [Gammaproteobacteria bacterium]|jgi:F-type H+-transporting ATPase subunit delta